MTRTSRQTVEFFARLGAQTASISDLKRLLQSVLRETLVLLQADSGSVMLFDPQENALVLYLSENHRGYKGQPLPRPGTSMSTTSGVAGLVFRSGKPLLVADLRCPPALEVPFPPSNSPGSFLSAPLKIHRRIIGVLNLNRGERLAGFCPADLRLLQAVQSQIAGLVEKGRLIDALKTNHAELEGLYCLTRILFESGTREQILPRFLHKLAERLGIEHSAVMALDRRGALATSLRNVAGNSGHNSDKVTPKEGDYRLLASHGLTKNTLKNLLKAVKEGIKTAENSPWTTDWNDPQLQPPLTLPFTYQRKQMEMSLIPLLLREGPPYLMLTSHQSNRFDPPTLRRHYRFLHLIAEQVKVAMERHHLLEHINIDREILLDNAFRNQIFLEISKELSSTLDPLQIVRRAFEHVGKLISHLSLSVLLHDELDQGYRLLIQPRQPLHRSFVQAIQREVLATFRDYPADPPLSHETTPTIEVLPSSTQHKGLRHRFGFSFSLPVIVDGKIVGLLHMTRPERKPFYEREMQIASQFVGIMIAAIRNARVHQRTEKLAYTDPLTGLNNHRFFQERLRQELTRSSRYQKPTALMILDIDFFKKFNDTYGHLIGDHVLVHVGKIFQRSVREKIDTVARYGGEEFAIILPETSVSGAQLFAERIREAVEQEKLQTDGHSLSITISIGVAATDTAVCDKPSELVHAADTALYEAKEQGRNQVRLYRPKET